MNGVTPMLTVVERGREIVMCGRDAFSPAFELADLFREKSFLVLHEKSVIKLKVGKKEHA